MPVRVVNLADLDRGVRVAEQIGRPVVRRAMDPLRQFTQIREGDTPRLGARLRVDNLQGGDLVSVLVQVRWRCGAARPPQSGIVALALVTLLAPLRRAAQFKPGRRFAMPDPTSSQQHPVHPGGGS